MSWQIAWTLAFVAAGVVSGYLAVKLDQNNQSLKLLFLVSSILSLLIGMGGAALFASNAGSATTYATSNLSYVNVTKALYAANGSVSGYEDVPVLAFENVTTTTTYADASGSQSLAEGGTWLLQILLLLVTAYFMLNLLVNAADYLRNSKKNKQRERYG